MRESRRVGTPSRFQGVPPTAGATAGIWPWALVAAAVSAALYVATAAPTITWRNDGADSGELAAAVMTLGIPHPPGYPTYVVLGRLATLVLPFGDAAHRLALFSALMGATAAGITVFAAALMVPFRGWPRNAGLVVGGLALGSSPLLWSQATIPEVYAPAAAVFAGGLLLVVLWDRQPLDGRLLGALGVLLGVGSGLHPTVLFLGLAALPFIGVYASGRGLLVGALGLALGVSVFALLPLLGARHPPIAWGDPVDLDGFLWTISGAPYRNLVFGISVAEVPTRLLSAAGLLARQLGPFGWLLAGWGAWLLWRTRRRAILIGALLAGVSFAYAVAYGSKDSFLYLIPVAIVGAVCLAQGCAALLQAAMAWRPWLMAVAFLALLATVPGLLIASNYRRLDLSQDQAARQYGADVATVAGPSGLVLADGDEHAFSLWYHRYVAAPEESPDVIVRTLLQFEWYRDQVRRQWPGLLPAEPVEYDAAVASVLAQAGTRPVYVTFQDPTAAERYDLQPAGPLFLLTSRAGAR